MSTHCQRHDRRCLLIVLVLVANARLLLKLGQIPEMNNILVNYSKTEVMVMCLGGIEERFPTIVPSPRKLKTWWCTVAAAPYNRNNNTNVPTHVPFFVSQEIV